MEYLKQAERTSKPPLQIETEVTYMNGNFDQNQGDRTQNQFFEDRPPIQIDGMPQLDPNKAQGLAKAKNSQTLAIVALILAVVCCPLAGLIMGIIALNGAKASRNLLGFEAPEAKAGRACGIIAIVLGALSMVYNAIILAIQIPALIEAFENMALHISDLL